MTAVRFPAFVLTAVAAFPLLTAPAAADTFRDEQRHFAIDLPGSWVRMSDDELIEHYEADEVFAPNRATPYVAGFRLKWGQSGTLPYVLVRVTPGPGRVSYGEIERGLADALPRAKADADAVLGLSALVSVTPPTLDRARNRAAMTVSMDAGALGPVRRLIVMHFGADATVVVACNDTEEGFSKRRPTFEKLNDSVRFDPGHEFHPADDPLDKLWMAGGGVLAVGLVVWLLVRAVGTRTRRLARRDWDEYERV